MKRKLALALGLVLFSSLASAQEKGFAAIKLAPAKAPLLCGRLTISVPEGAQQRPVARNVNAPPEDPTRQMRYLLELGKSRLVLVADELMAKAPGSLEDAVKKGFAGQNPGPSIRTVSLGGLKGVLIAPPVIGSDREINLVRILYTTTPDGAVQMLTYYASADAAKDPALPALAEASLLTTRAGSRTLQSAAGVRKLGVEAKRSLAVTVPAGHIVTHQKGQDFDVWQVQKLATFGSEIAVLGLYVGAHPSLAGEKAKAPQLRTIKVLGKDAEWKTWQPNPSSWSGETLVPAVSGDRKLHAFSEATSAPLADGLLEILKSAHWVDGPGDPAPTCK